MSGLLHPSPGQGIDNYDNVKEDNTSSNNRHVIKDKVKTIPMYLDFTMDAQRVWN
jgi:hypothetical protein